MAGRRRLLAFAACALALAAGAAGEGGLRLDLEVLWPPVLSEGTLYLFGAENRLQILKPGEAAPQCSPAPVASAVAPLAASGAVWAVDGEGSLWRLGGGPPRLVEGGFSGALRLLPGDPRPAILLKERLVLPDGQSVSLPFEARDGNALGEGGYWIRGEAAALRLAADGRPVFTWKPPAGAPGPALLAGDRLYAGTSRGDLVALSAATGRRIFRFAAGGELTAPPAAAGGLVVFATSNHFVRALDGKGRVLWHFRLEGRPLSGPLVLPQGIFLSEAVGSRLLLLSPSDGKLLWSWRCPEGDLRLPPAVSPGRALVLAWTEAREPILYDVALSAAGAKGGGR